MAHPSFEIKKTYRAELSRPLTEECEALLARGVKLDDGPTGPALIEVISARRRRVDITIHEGRNRIVRRMFASVGSPVIRLRRTRFGTMSINEMPKRAWRDLTLTEVASLLDLTINTG